MVKDRTEELNNARKRQPRPVQSHDSVVSNIPLQPIHTSITEKDPLDSFTNISNSISKLRRLIRSLEQLYEKTLNAPTFQDASVQQDISSLTHTIQQSIQRITQDVKQVDTSTKVGQVQRNKVVEEFQRAIRSFQDVQSRSKSKFQDRLKRQLRIVHPQASEEELAQLMTTQKEYASVFSTQLTQSNARKQLQEAQSQHDALQELVASIESLHQLFLELSLLVQEQQPVLDAAEVALETAEVDLELAVNELDKGRNYAKASRRKRYWIYFCALLLVGAAVVAAYFLFLKDWLIRQRQPK
jgi:syntaxin 1B/2/3